ncbi:hypothetical protein RHSIM_Rhsim01G0130300 [Rhododendron simsii]|uniref:ABC transporter domain-containing protein n=1 Tax=Rhododendron simsii TaxID=118357 RepID=A0A834HLB6_RHOSS|nr:hypothetical protein RHSIM_Rhsim01G0130300 [Rhododendron simsii]
MAVKNLNPTVVITNLSFTYPGIDGHSPPGSTPLIDEFSLTLHSGDRCLLVGSNGAVDLFHASFHSKYSRIGSDLLVISPPSTEMLLWRRDVAFAGFEVPIQMDVFADKMIFGVSGVDPHRRAELIKVLDIDLSWRKHKVSDGQRRRVQICMGLLKPFKVLLLDEITVDLDMLVRADLHKFLRKECEERGATIIYATHIFDGLKSWPSHIVYVAHGNLQLAMPMDKVKEISNMSLMRTVEQWLRKERDEERKRRKDRKANGLLEFEKQVDGNRVAGGPAIDAVRATNNGWAAGRMHSIIAGEENFVFSSNRVLRQ